MPSVVGAAREVIDQDAQGPPLVSDRLAHAVGDFLLTVCPEQIVLREVRNRGSGKKKDAAKATA